MKNKFKVTVVKQSSISSIVLAIAFLCYYFISFSHELFWLLIASYLTSLPYKGQRFRLTVSYVVLLISAILYTHFILEYSSKSVLYLTLGILVVLGNLARYIRQSFSDAFFFYLTLFILLVIVSSVLNHPAIIKFRIADCVLGCLIGYTCALMLGRRNINADFRAGIVPVFKILKSYSSLLSNEFCNSTLDRNKAATKQFELMVSLTANKSQYPEYIYSLGFNPGVRSGLRFFLINLEQIIESFFSMAYLSAFKININKYAFDRTINYLDDLLLTAMDNNVLLLDVLINYFEKNSLTNLESDFTRDLTDLDNAVRNQLPLHVTLWDISSDYIVMTSFIRNIRDIRLTLMQLIISLPPLSPPPLPSQST